jgi:hypothetical protein
MSNNAVAGYLGGGNDAGTFYDTVDKFAFPSDTRTTLGTGLSAVRFGLSAAAKTNVAGYFAGGLTTGSAAVNTVDKFVFPSETRTTLGTGISSARSGLSGMANEG